MTTVNSLSQCLVCKQTLHQVWPLSASPWVAIQCLSGAMAVTATVGSPRIFTGPRVHIGTSYGLSFGLDMKMGAQDQFWLRLRLAPGFNELHLQPVFSDRSLLTPWVTWLFSSQDSLCLTDGYACWFLGSRMYFPSSPGYSLKCQKNFVLYVPF